MSHTQFAAEIARILIKSDGAQLGRIQSRLSIPMPTGELQALLDAMVASGLLTNRVRKGRILYVPA